MVIADGSTVVARAGRTEVTSPGGEREVTEDDDLFWAVRGGGAGPWGVVTALTVKVHRPRESCRTGCYTQWGMRWEGDFNEDDGQMAKDVITAYLAWVATASRYWDFHGTGQYGIMT